MLAIRRQNWPKRQIQKERGQARRLKRNLLFRKRRKRTKRKNESQRKGEINERRVWEALGTVARPCWVLKVRRPTRQEDRFEAKDIVILTRLGFPIALQVKSSLGGLEKFLAGKHASNPRLGAIVVGKHDSPETIAENAWRILANVYNQAKLLMPVDTLVQQFGRE